MNIAPDVLALSQSIALFRAAEIRMRNRSLLNSSEFRMLIYLVNSGLPRVIPLQISQYFRCSKAFVSKMVRRMEERGWVQRVRNPEDGRSWALAATEAGIRVVEETMRDYTRTTEALYRAFGPERSKLFKDLLDQATETLLGLGSAQGSIGRRKETVEAVGEA